MTDNLIQTTDLKESKRGYNLCSKEYGKALVKEFVPKEVCRKIKSKNLLSKEKERILYYLAVLIMLCRENGTNKVKISMDELNKKYLHMQRKFVSSAREFLVDNGFIYAYKHPGGTEFTLRFSISETQTQEQETSYSVETSEDGVERLLCEPVTPTSEEKHEMTFDEVVLVIERQQGEIMNLRDEKSTLSSENESLKEKIKELEGQLNKLKGNDIAKKIEAAKEKSPLLNNAFGEWLGKLF
jgi:hypothetical protein